VLDAQLQVPYRTQPADVCWIKLRRALLPHEYRFAQATSYGLVFGRVITVI